MGGLVRPSLPGHVVAFHVRVGRDIGTIHEARIVGNYIVVSGVPAIPRVVVRVELNSKEVDVPYAVEHLVRSGELTFNVIVVIIVVTGTVAAHSIYGD